jgi:hypothetical protein
VNTTQHQARRSIPLLAACIAASACGGVDEAEQRCGNDSVEGGELCDGTDLAENDCETIGEDLVGGTLACNETCDGWNTSDCEVPVGTLVGTVSVRRGVTCGEAPADCVGTVYVFVAEENPAVKPMQTPLASTSELDADLREKGHVSYSFSAVRAGTWWLGAFQDDDENANPAAPVPATGDPVLYPFPEVTIRQGETTTRDIVLTQRL